MSSVERPVPPLNADERTTLESRLDFHRTPLVMKCEGPDDEQAAVASVPSSGFTPTGLVQHTAEVERNRFRRVFAGEQAPRRPHWGSRPPLIPNFPEPENLPVARCGTPGSVTAAVRRRASPTGSPPGSGSGRPVRP
ncbi:DUF664 domain-containing protein [Streptomyces sp. bgisy095]|uniref:mycothiol transferase n=1 Tax=unclassified Streptomyces TaxID=2593676 RepID=UPI003D714557